MAFGPQPLQRPCRVPWTSRRIRHSSIRPPRPVPPAAAGPRQLKPKADPLEVRAYFASTGLSRRELGQIVGTGVGVIATVQNPNGDRWSIERFERAQASSRRTSATP